MAVFFLFLLALAAGTLTTLFWIPEDDLGRGYYQLNALILLCLLGLAIALWALHPFAPFGGEALGAATLAGAFVAGFVYYAAIWRERWRAGRWAAAVCLGASAVALVIAARSLMPAVTALPHRGPLLALALATAALLAGWSLVTMLLGHWYLVAPRLSFRHLTVFCGVLLGLVVARAGAAGVAMWTAAGVAPEVEPHPWRLLVGFEGQGMFLWFRLLWGLAIPLALAVMSLQCARQRSNQSATGILYVLVVGSFIGEITALYLTLSTGVPI